MSKTITDAYLDLPDPHDIAMYEVTAWIKQNANRLGDDVEQMIKNLAAGEYTAGNLRTLDMALITTAEYCQRIGELGKELEQWIELLKRRKS